MTLRHCQTPTLTRGNIVKNIERRMYVQSIAHVNPKAKYEGISKACDTYSTRHFRPSVQRQRDTIENSNGDSLEQDLPRGRPHLPQVPRRRPRLAGFRIEDLRRRPLPQVPDLRAPHPAVPGKLPRRRGHPGLAPGRARTGEAARGYELAGVRVPARDRRQPVPVADGPRLPGAVRGRLQPQRGRGLRRHQRRGAVHRRHRHRGRLRVRAPCARHRKSTLRSSAAGRPDSPPRTSSAGAATGARSTTTTRRSAA